MTDVLSVQAMYERIHASDLLAAMEQLAKDAADNPAFAAEGDQLAALVSGIQEQALQKPNVQVGMADERMLALMFTTINAIFRRGRLYHREPCPHFLRTVQPFKALLGCGITGCVPCIQTMLADSLAAGQGDDDDGHCDLCDREVPNRRFWPHQMHLMNVHVMADVCSHCNAFMRGTTRKPPPRRRTIHNDMDMRTFLADLGQDLPLFFQVHAR